jgi:hypothetical protein
MAAYQVPSAWALLQNEEGPSSSSERQVVVQVVSSGATLTHEDLQRNWWSNGGETDCTNGIDDDGNGYVDDCHGYNFADESGTSLEGTSACAVQ